MALMMATLAVMLATYVAAFVARYYRLNRKLQTFTQEHVEVINLKDSSRQLMRFDEVTGVRVHTTFLQSLARTGNITFESGAGSTLTITDVSDQLGAALELMALCPKLPEAGRFAQNALITAGRSWRPSLKLYASRRDLKFVGQHDARGPEA